MILQRLRNLWRISGQFYFDEKGALEIYADDEEEGRVRTLVTARALLPKKWKGEAVVIPYKPRDPVKEITDQLPENQKEI